MTNLPILVFLAASWLPARATDELQPAAPCAPVVEWNARRAEHLLNRAAFGARPGEVEEWVALGLEGAVERLLAVHADVDPPFVESIEEPPARAMKELSADEQKRVRRDVADRDRRQQVEYVAWWVDRMVQNDDPLRDRMTLFWHGFFTSSIEQVRRSYPMAKQGLFLRAHALESYAELLAGIAKDPAMLLYLDNTSNRKGNPNENLARELMELFSLGIGNYTEKDVKEAARALTGRATTRACEYEYRAKQHDGGEKTILGNQGKFDGDDLVRILLEQDACPRHVARRILVYFEGVEPEAARLAEYAAFLRSNDFALRPFLRKLFLDPAFYRDELAGARVQSPIDYLVGMTRRLDTDVPPALIASGAALLGQRLLAPPNVKGWDEGLSWISTSSLMQRGNLAGLVLGVVRMEEVLDQADLLAKEAELPPADGAMASNEPTMSAEQREEMTKRLKSGKKGGYAYESLRRALDAGAVPTVNFTARMQRARAATDAEIVDRLLDELLAIQAPLDTRSKLIGFVTQERVQTTQRDGHLLDAGPAAERILRRLAHLILSLPEAQLM